MLPMIRNLLRPHLLRPAVKLHRVCSQAHTAKVFFPTVECVLHVTTTSWGKRKEKSIEDPKGSPASEQLTPEQILSLGLGFWDSKMLLDAVGIGLFNELVTGSLSFETLAERPMLLPRRY